ncbi:hypothetical protein HY932_02480, partial [Candidatus Falkowbacteria bacterium]|nr:hypothetical protein [Candidatus Falkowbacteria bacterium]
NGGMKMEEHEPTKEEIAEWRAKNEMLALMMTDRQVARRLKAEWNKASGNAGSGGASANAGELARWPEGFSVPVRSKRGQLWPKSADNPANVVEPNQGFLLPKVELTLPEKAVEMLAQMFTGLNVGSTEDVERALKVGVIPAVKACQSLGISEDRLVVFPWVKRSALARIGGVEEDTHYGALIEAVVFPKLSQEYKKRKIVFQNYRAGKMGTDNYLQMESQVAEWLIARESETAGDICFSAAVLDLFNGFCVDASRYETDKEKRLVDGTCYLVQQMLLTQSQLQTKWEELHWWMPGDRYDVEGKARFPSSLFCDVYGDEFRFAHAHTADASSYGSVVFPFEMLY